MKLISVDNLSVSFGAKPILKDISFDIEMGDILAIIGPNGAGKTVLVRTILGLNKTFTGQVVWHTRPETSYVPQKISFEKNFPLTVKEFFLLELGQGNSFWFPSAKSLTEIKSKLTEVRAEHLLNFRLCDLSQGEMQRILIARSLLENPQIVFFDEPASGIDIGTEETVYTLLHSLHKKNNLTMVLISHEINIVYRFATKVICLNKEMICQGTPQEVLTADSLQNVFGRHAGIYKHGHGLNIHDHN